MRTRLVGVLDVKAGQAVHAIAGKRDAYQPIGDVFGGSSEPHTVAERLLKTGATELYLADLDALAGRKANNVAIATVASLGVPTLLDSGLAEIEANAHVRRIAAIEAVPPFTRTSFPVFGLDLRNGEPLAPSWGGGDPMPLVDWAIDVGYRSIVVVDIAAVGTGAPSTLELCRRIRSIYPQVELIAGGGVQQIADVKAFQTAGCDAVLVGTALHRGRLDAS